MKIRQLLRQHLLPAITVAYILGLIASSCTCTALSLLAVPTLLLLIFVFGRPGVSPFLLLLLFFALGLYGGEIAGRLPDSADHIINHTGEEVVVVGMVNRLTGFNGEVSRLDVDAGALRTAQSAFQPVHGMVRFTLKGPMPEEIVPGQTVAIRAKLKRPQRLLTPGSFDYPAYLAASDIHVTGFIASPVLIAAVQKAESGWQLQYLPEKVREKINRFIDASLNGDTAAIYKALLTGDRAAISPAVVEQFKGTGCLHILAISGLHMSLLGLFLFALFFWLLRRSEWLILRINTKKTAALLCILPLLFYALIAGAKAPVLRSFVMSLVVILAICFGRRHSFLPLISCAALFLLILSPEQLFTASFQLSFIAVISIAAMAPLLTDMNTRIRQACRVKLLSTAASWTAGAMMVSLAATLGSAPFLLYHFNRISMVGIAANLIVEPLLCLWSLPIGFAAIILIGPFPAAASLLFAIGGLGIETALWAAAFFHAIPSSSVFLPAPSLLQIIVYYLSFLPLVLNTWRGGVWRYAKYALPAFSLLLLAFPPAEMGKSVRRASTLAFLDVGHGSCTLVEMPGGRRVLIDGGAISASTFDVGEGVIAPYLFRRGIASIDDVVVTHADSDHYNGLDFILRHFHVKNLWIATTEQGSEGWQRLLQTASRQQVSVRVAQGGDLIHDQGPASLTVLANTASPTAATSNDNGLILSFRHAAFSALFPGDISASMERKLVREGIAAEADLLLSAHHGSATSSSQEFLDSVSPAVMVVSSGRHSASTYPAASVRERCRLKGVTILPTHTVGTITVTITKQGEYRIDTLPAD